MPISHHLPSRPWDPLSGNDARSSDPKPRSEIRTPLHQIKNLTSLLRTTLAEATDPGGNLALTFVDRLEESTDQLENTMVNLLGFFRSDQEPNASNKPGRTPERKTVQEALQETIEVCLLKERLARRSRSEGNFYPEIVIDIGAHGRCGQLRRVISRRYIWYSASHARRNSRRRRREELRTVRQQGIKRYSSPTEL